MMNLSINQFGGINKKIGDFDQRKATGQDVKNLTLSAKLGDLTKCDGYRTANLAPSGETAQYFKPNGLEGNTINAFAELVTDAEGSNGPYYVVQAGDDLYYWSTNMWISLSASSLTTFDSSKVKFLQRGDRLVCMTGDDEDNYPIIIVYREPRFTHAYTGTDKSTQELAGGLTAFRATLEKPAASDYLSASAESYGAWYGANYFRFKLAVQYDGYQWSPPSDDYIQVYLSSEGSVRLSLEVTASTFNDRITAFRIFRSASENSYPQSTDRYKLLTEVGVNDDLTFVESSKTYVENSYATLSGSTFTYNTNRELSADCFNNMPLAVLTTKGGFTDMVDNAEEILFITDTTNSGNGEIVVDDEGLTDGNYYIMPSLGWYYDGGVYYWGWWNTDDKSLSDTEEMWENLGYIKDAEHRVYNYALAELEAKRQFIADYHNGDQTIKNKVLVSSISTDGAYEYDKYFETDVINLQAYQTAEIMNMIGYRGKLYVFGQEKVIILDLGNGREFTWSVYEIAQQAGLAATKSAIRIYDQIYYLSQDGPRVIDRGTSIKLPHLEDQDNWPIGLETVSDAVSGFDKDKSKWYLAFPTESKCYVFDLIVKEWTEFDIPLAIDNMAASVDGRLMFTDGSAIWQIGQYNTFGPDSIVPYFKSAKYKVDGVYLNPFSYQVFYESDSDISMEIHLDGENILTSAHTLPSGSTVVSNNVPVGKLGSVLEFVFTMTPANATANTEFVIKALNITLEKREIA